MQVRTRRKQCGHRTIGLREDTSNERQNKTEQKQENFGSCFFYVSLDGKYRLTNFRNKN